MQIFNPAEFATLGARQTQALTEVQKEWASLFQQANEDWRARAALEREMAAELTGKLVAASHDWIARHLDLMTKGGQKFLADSQKFVNLMTRGAAEWR